MFEFKLLHTSPPDIFHLFCHLILFIIQNSNVVMTMPRLLQGAQLTKGPHCCTLKLVSALAPRPCLPWADSTITEWGRHANEDPFLGDTGVSTLTVNFGSKTHRWLCWNFHQPLSFMQGQSHITIWWLAQTSASFLYPFMDAFLWINSLHI